MKLKTIAKCAALGLALTVMPLQAQTSDTAVEKKSRLTIGGYSEAVYTRNFYSDNMFRYSHAERYKDAKGHGRVDLPHVVINLGYDFGKGFNIHMENDIRTGWCRTTPLWGRGLSAICTGRSDRLHDCRAQTVIEAIMWHGNAQSDARRTVEKFRELSKEDRDAVVKFIDAI